MTEAARSRQSASAALLMKRRVRRGSPWGSCVLWAPVGCGPGRRMGRGRMTRDGTVVVIGRIVVVVLTLVVLGLAAGLGGCGGVRVTRAAAVSDPVTVFVADYGRHASLIVPGDGVLGGEGVDAVTDVSADVALGGGAGMWEYSFGDWVFYAEDRDSIFNGAFAVLVPTRGTLGRRRLPVVSDEAELRAAFDVELEKVLTFDVERDRARSLLRVLHERYEDGRAFAGELGLEPRTLQNDVVGLVFVPDRASYSIGRHCNDEVADWLRELGLEVRGSSLVSRYSVEGE